MSMFKKNESPTEFIWCGHTVVRRSAETVERVLGTFIQGRNPSDPVQKSRDILYTPTLQESRMPKIQGGKGEAIVSYAEPLTTQEMGYHELSRRVNKMKNRNKSHISLVSSFGLRSIEV